MLKRLVWVAQCDSMILKFKRPFSCWNLNLTSSHCFRQRSFISTRCQQFWAMSLENQPEQSQQSGFLLSSTDTNSCLTTSQPPVFFSLSDALQTELHVQNNTVWFGWEKETRQPCRFPVWWKYYWCATRLDPSYIWYTERESLSPPLWLSLINSSRVLLNSRYYFTDSDTLIWKTYLFVCCWITPGIIHGW